MFYTQKKSSEMVWGGHFEPNCKKNLKKKGLRTVVFASTTAGHLLLDHLIRYEKKHPEELNLVGIATDDPLDTNTKISVKKRIWNYYSRSEMNEMLSSILNLSSNAGIECYTGSVKTDYFRALIQKWDPDVIIMCCFGQKIDAVIFDYPKMGMYNFHPSDLAARIGAGAHPFQETMLNGNQTSLMTIHHVTEHIDVGPIVGQSPPVCIVDERGNHPDDVKNLQEKIPSVCGWMGVELIKTLIGLKQSALYSKIDVIDFSARFPQEIKDKLLEYVKPDPSLYKLPDHPDIL